MSEQSQKQVLLADAFYSREEAARIVGIATITVDRALAAGRLHANRVGRRVVLQGADIKAWLAQSSAKSEKN